MQTCYNCGRQVDDNVLICPDCGALVRRYGRPAPEPAAAGGEEDEEARYRAAAALCRSTREMAAMLRTSQSTVVRKLKKYGLHPSGA